VATSMRDALFIGANAAIGAFIGFAVSKGALSEGSAVPPLMLIFVGMAAVELIGAYAARIPLGQLVAMPARFAALVVAFGGYLLTTNV